MPKISKQTAEAQDFGLAVDHTGDIAGHTVNLVSIRETHTLADMLRGLPGDSCDCPHWGYMLAGEMTVTYADGTHETYSAGDAFYMTPGHVPGATAGSEFVMFSPADKMAETTAAIMANMQARTG
jgi:hypothetical protein